MWKITPESLPAFREFRKKQRSHPVRRCHFLLRCGSSQLNEQMGASVCLENGKDQPVYWHFRFFHLSVAATSSTVVPPLLADEALPYI
jgi:hypothetical protein